MFLQFTSYLYPGSVLHYKYDPSHSGPHVFDTFKQSKVPGFDPSEFVTYRTVCHASSPPHTLPHLTPHGIHAPQFATSKDGTKVPLFVTRSKASLERGGPCPTILYGYGGFNISITPWFSAIRLVWLKELGGCYAIAKYVAAQRCAHRT